MVVKKKVDPQPLRPVVDFYYDITDQGDHSWFYQRPEFSDDMPELIHNASYPFEDENQPGNIGDLYEGKAIKGVSLLWEVAEESYYWWIDVED